MEFYVRQKFGLDGNQEIKLEWPYQVNKYV